MRVDLGPRPDLGPRDAGSPDVPVMTTDAGPPPSFPFTGVYGILNAQDSLFAQEISGSLMLIVGRPPFIYVGSISPEGQVDVTSHVILRSGCGVARISGTYDRVNAVFSLEHTVCSQMTGLPVTSTLEGGFLQNYVQSVSGIYELTATPTPVGDPGCYTGMPQTVRYGVNVLADQTMIIFTASDLIDEPAVYIGRAEANLSVQATLPVEGDVFAASFQQLTANDPMRMMGLRDIFQPAGPCRFQVTVDGIRLSLL